MFGLKDEAMVVDHLVGLGGRKADVRIAYFPHDLGASV